MTFDPLLYTEKAIIVETTSKEWDTQLDPDSFETAREELDLTPEQAAEFDADLDRRDIFELFYLANEYKKLIKNNHGDGTDQAFLKAIQAKIASYGPNAVENAVKEKADELLVAKKHMIALKKAGKLSRRMYDEYVLHMKELERYKSLVGSYDLSNIPPEDLDINAEPELPTSTELKDPHAPYNVGVPKKHPDNKGEHSRLKDVKKIDKHAMFDYANVEESKAFADTLYLESYAPPTPEDILRDTMIHAKHYGVPLTEELKSAIQAVIGSDDIRAEKKLQFELEAFISPRQAEDVIGRLLVAKVKSQADYI